MNVRIRLAAALLLLASLTLAPCVLAGTADPPLQVGTVLGGQLRAPVIDGTRVYVPSGRIVTTWDYGDPAAPQRRAVTAPANGLIQGLTRLGGYLYAGWQAGDDNAGLAIYSLADPDAPELVAQVDDYTTMPLRVLRSVAAANGHLYLFDAENGVFYGTVDDPEQPVFTRAFRTPTRYESAAAFGHWIFTHATTLMGNTALVVFDVSDPTAPTAVSGSNQFFNTDLFAIHANPPLAAGFGLLLTLFDVADPANVVQRGQIETPPATHGAVIGDHAYSVGFDGLDAWNISDPDHPVAAGHFDIPTLGTDATAVVGNHALLLTSTDRLVRIDGSTPAQPAVASLADLPGGTAARDVALHGEHAIVLQEAYGFSVADPDTLVASARFDADLPQQLNMRDFEQFAVYGNRVYLTAWGYGLIVVDIADPAQPVELGRLPWEFASAAAAQGDFVYLGKTTNGGEVRVVDVSDPAAPVLRGQFLANDVQRVQVHGSRVFIADALLGGLRIVDVADPDAPVQIGFYDQGCDSLGATATDVALSADGATAYVACPTGLHIVDVGNPTQPVQLGVHPTDGFSFRATVEIRGDRAWYGDIAGVHEIDVSDPAAPTLLATTSLGYYAPNRLRATPDGRLFAFGGIAGVHVFGTSAPDDIIFADGFEAPPSSLD